MNINLDKEQVYSLRTLLEFSARGLVVGPKAHILAAKLLLNINDQIKNQEPSLVSDRYQKFIEKEMNSVIQANEYQT